MDVLMTYEWLISEELSARELLLPSESTLRGWQCLTRGKMSNPAKM